MKVMTAYGRRAATSVMRSDVEKASSGCGPVTSYVMSEEELKRYRAMNVPKRNKSKPIELKSGGSSDMGTFALTREQYIEQRKRGKSRAEIAKEQGVTAAGLLYHLGKWGMKTEADERQFLQETGQLEAEPTTSGNVPQPKVTVEQSQSESLSYINVRIPLAYEGLVPELKEKYDRDTLIHDGVRFLQTAAAWATKELLDIMGDADPSDVIQKFIERKVSEVCKDESA